MESVKDVEVEGRRYQIGRMTARNGSWVLMQIMTKMLPAGAEAGLAGVPGGRPVMSEEEFHTIQDHCLAVCRRYEDVVNGAEVALPIMARPGVFAVKELEYDIVSTMSLTVHALAFNLQPFFTGGGLQSVMRAVQGLNPSNSPA